MNEREIGLGIQIETFRHSDTLYEIPSNSSELLRINNRDKTIVVISGPPGAGKDTIVEALISDKTSGTTFERFRTATTRPPRPSEKSMLVDPYHRYEMIDFIKADLKHIFLETNLHQSDNGVHYYGTPTTEFHRIWNNGNHPVLRVDPNGAYNLRKYWKEGRDPLDQSNLIYFYVTAPSIEDIEERLITRERNDGKEDEVAIQNTRDRMSQVVKDLAGIGQAHYVLVNHDNRWGECVEDIRSVLQQFLDK